jgi:uncharacterized damage-inducible protein DinB
MAVKQKHGEAGRIADQLRRAFDGSAWHGPSLLELLSGVDAATAAAKPLANVHSIWELVLHIAVWDRSAIVRLGGEVSQPTGDLNFPPVGTVTRSAWLEAVSEAKRTHSELVKVVGKLSDAQLRERCPGKRYDYYHLLHGVVQHELYHAGQIAILKKVQRH